RRRRRSGGTRRRVRPGRGGSWRRRGDRRHRIRPERVGLAADILFGGIDFGGLGSALACRLFRLVYWLRGVAGRLVALALDRVGFGRIGLGRIGLGGICRGSFSLGGIPRRIFSCSIARSYLFGFRRFFDGSGPATSALFLPDARFAVGRGLHRSLAISRLGGIGCRVRPCEPLRVSPWTRALALRWGSVSVRPGSLLRRCGRWQPATGPVGLIRLSVLLGV